MKQLSENPMKRLRRQSGISLVEILVSLVISLFLLGGIVQVYSGNKATFKFTGALAELQENGRFAIETMTQDLRLAGVWGCVAYDPLNTENIASELNTMGNYDPALHDFAGQTPIEGDNNSGLNGSDSITIRGGKPGQSNVTGPFAPLAIPEVTVAGEARIGGNDFVMIARCGANDLKIEEDADIMRVTASNYDSATDKTRLSLAGNKTQRYENDSSVIELQTVTYSIQNSTLGTNEPTLVRTEFDQDEELVEGVEDMQILYGVDDDGDGYPNRYFQANDVVNFNSVVSVRIQLLLHSFDDRVTEDPQTYTFNGVTVTPNDRRIRQVFSTTIALRNRIGST